MILKKLNYFFNVSFTGVITDTLGLSDDLRVETLAILKEFCLDTTPFSPDMIQLLPKSKVTIYYLFIGD